MHEHPTTERTTHDILRSTLTIISFLFILALTIDAALALSITNINAPTTISEGETLHVNFTTDEPASYEIRKNDVIVATTNEYTETLGYDTAGLDEYTFTATNGSVVTEHRTVEVLDKPLELTINEPSTTDYATSNVPVDVETNIPVTLCYVVTETATHTLDMWNATHYNDTLSFADGLHEFTIKCEAAGEIKNASITLKVDTTPPTVTLTPTGTSHEESVTLTATTNEATSCKYDTTSKTYTSMANAFPESASLSHETTLELDDGTYEYFIACKDALGNEGTGETTFTVQQAPTATVSVEGENPHKAGTYQVTLETSEAVVETPSLNLAYQGSGGATALALEQVDDRTYKGFVIVPEDAGERVGSFTFSATDLEGVEGTKITDGALFVTDTVKPSKVETFKAVNAEESINLSWYYEEEGVRYNLYRAAASGVDYTDYYKTVGGDEYQDYETTTATKYYYRIAAVDDAGNIGPLSHEEWASALARTYEEEQVEERLDPLLQYTLNEHVKRVDKLLLDAQRTLADLREETNTDKLRVINALGLVTTAQKAVEELDAAQKAFAALRTRTLNKTTFDERVTAINEDVDAALAKLPLTITVDDTTSYDETPTEAQVEAAATRALQGVTLSDAERRAYVDNAHELQATTSVTTTATTATIRYASGSSKELTIVQKLLLSNELQRDLIAVENIPKGMAKDVGEVTFVDPQPQVLEADPVVQYAYDTLVEERLTYYVEQLVDQATLHDSILVLLGAPPDAMNGNPSPERAPSDGTMTGFISSTLSTVGSGQGLALLIGILIAGGLLLYYLRLQKEDEFFETGTPTTAYPATPSPSVPVLGNNVMPTATPFIAKTVLVNRERETFTSLLLRGHQLIDENKYVDALYFYKQGLQRYDEERFPSARVKQAFQEELSLLHAKLKLFDTLSCAHDASYAGDLATLKTLLDESRSWASVVGDEPTSLVEKAKATYAYLYLSLHRLEASSERAFADEDVLTDEERNT